MQSLQQKIEAKYMKKQVVDVKSGDTVRVHQKIKEGSKERVQVFEGLVIRTKRRNSSTSSITVRRIASGVGVEKTFMLHSPLVTKIEVVKRSDVNRNYLTYMRERSGKSARLESIEFDRDQVNTVEEEAEAEEVDEAKPEADEQAVESEKADEKPADEVEKAEPEEANKADAKNNETTEEKADEK